MTVIPSLVLVSSIVPSLLIYSFFMFSMPTSTFPSISTMVEAMSVVDPPLISRDTSPPPTRLLKKLPMAASASRYRSLPTPYPLMLRLPLSVKRRICPTLSNSAPEPMLILSVWSSVESASGFVLTGSAVLFQRSVLASTSKSLTLPFESEPARRLISPFVVMSTPLPT